jgi:hypothetical protein
VEPSSPAGPSRSFPKPGACAEKWPGYRRHRVISAANECTTDEIAAAVRSV